MTTEQVAAVVRDLNLIRSTLQKDGWHDIVLADCVQVLAVHQLGAIDDRLAKIAACVDFISDHLPIR